MKKTLTMLLLSVSLNVFAGEPITCEAITKDTSINDALSRAKKLLLGEKFAPTNSTMPNSFTATRTTGSKSDYFVADVTAEKVNDKIKVTIIFIKYGTGLFGLKKCALRLKEELEK